MDTGLDNNEASKAQQAIICPVMINRGWAGFVHIMVLIQQQAQYELQN